MEQSGEIMVVFNSKTAARGNFINQTAILLNAQNIPPRC